MLIPKANIQDVLIEEEYKDKVEIVPVSTMKEVLEHALEGKKKEKLIKKLEAMEER